MILRLRRSAPTLIRTYGIRSGVALVMLGLSLRAAATDPLELAKPLDPTAPLVLGIGRPNGPELAASARSALEPYLSRALGRPVQVRILTDYDALTGALAEGKVDIAWTTPLAFVLATQRRPEVTALAKAMRGNELYYRAAFIVRSDAPVAGLKDLKGRRIGWVSKSSSSGYLFPRALLAASGEDPDRFFSGEAFLLDHPSVCKAVRERRVDVGATFSDEPRKGEPARADGCAESPPMSDFKIVAASGPIPNDVIAARADLDDRLRDPVLTAFARMSQDDEGQRILKDVFHADAWGLAVEGDFKAVQEVLAKSIVPPAKKAASKGKRR